MKPWVGYKQRVLKSAMRLDLSVIEKTIIVLVLLMLGISSWDSLQGRDIGDKEQIRLAKLKAQQELMAFNIGRE